MGSIKHQLYADAFLMRDAAAFEQALAPDIQIHSPIKHGRLSGRAFAGKVMGMFFDSIRDVELVDVLTGENSAALITAFTFERRHGEFLHHLTFDNGGQVECLRLMVRPFSMAKLIVENVSDRVSVH